MIPDALSTALFIPHGYLIGTEARPSQITIYGLTGGPDRWLKIRLDLSQPPVTFAIQAHAAAKTTPIVPFHGPTTGFIVNHTPTRSVRFDLSGNPIECLPFAYSPGQVEPSVGGPKISAQRFAKLIGRCPTGQSIFAAMSRASTRSLRASASVVFGRVPRVM